MWRWPLHTRSAPEQFARCLRLFFETKQQRACARSAREGDVASIGTLHHASSCNICRIPLVIGNDVVIRGHNKVRLQFDVPSLPTNTMLLQERSIDFLCRFFSTVSRSVIVAVIWNINSFLYLISVREGDNAIGSREHGYKTHFWLLEARQWQHNLYSLYQRAILCPKF